MRWKRLIASCFGLGRLPVAPGTWGSVPPVLVFSLLLHFDVSAPVISVTMGIMVVAGSAACVIFAPSAVSALGKTDPGEVVADEFAGQALTYLAVPFLLPVELSIKQCCFVAGAGFVLFRLFDIVKPWPIRKLEKLPAGWGILADDLLAGVFAAVGLIACVKLWISG
jgi:phosphatidylglycerophosphatase A